MKKVSRNWTEKEDRVLVQIMQQCEEHKRKWEDVAERIRAETKSQKTGKQCRERWHNQLAPQSKNHHEWTPQQNNRLIDLHNQFGNKWAKIAQQFQGRTDNTIKNHFYSTIRRGLRKLNSFIHNVKRKKGSFKEFKQDLLNKVVIVADGDQNQKYDTKNQATLLAKSIKDKLLKIALDPVDIDDHQIEFKEKAFEQMSQFARNCKKKKGLKNMKEELIKEPMDGAVSEQSSEEVVKIKDDGLHLEKQKQGNCFTFNIEKQKESSFKPVENPSAPTRGFLTKSSFQSIGSISNGSWNFLYDNSFDFFRGPPMVNFCANAEGLPIISTERSFNSDRGMIDISEFQRNANTNERSMFFEQNKGNFFEPPTINSNQSNTKELKNFFTAVNGEQGDDKFMSIFDKNDKK